MTDNQDGFNRALCEFLAAATTPFHAVKQMVKQLSEAGFTRLVEDEAWKLDAGGGYYVVRNDSSIVAFRVGST